MPVSTVRFSAAARARSPYRTTAPWGAADALRISRHDVLVWDMDRECRGGGGGAGRRYATAGKKRAARV